MYSVQVTKGDLKITGMAADLDDVAELQKKLEDYLAGKVEAVKNENVTTAGVEIPKEKPRKTKEKVDDNNQNNEVASEEKSSDKEEGSGKKASSKETSKKPKVSIAKGVAYDKNNPTHKALIGSFMDEVIPAWRTPKTIHKAKHASETLFAEGVDLLDRDGEILDAFKQKFLELYNSVE